MTNYTKTTDFAAKDALPSGNSAKIVKGSEIDTEFNNIATASATKANANSAALTGTTTFETISDGTIAITAFVDEDNMASDSATLLPTQQSVKAYVDSQVTAQDLDVTDGSTSIDIDLDSESLGILGGTGIDSTASGTGVTLAIDSTVATLTGSQTLSNKTLSTPVVSGNLTTDGLLDGRDVAADGTKLDGIESGATADQTAAEIKTAYESNADTNAFTDADESKLDGIEASADVTDTANVTAAGALMDSELTSEASVKALNQGVATTDSPTFAGLTTTADVSFGDNDKAIFGAGSDLQIYHNGSHSYVTDAGTGNLNIQSNGVGVVIAHTDGTDLAVFNAGNGSVSLYNSGNLKLATTSTGIDVTGTVTADGLDVSSTGEVVSTVRTTSTSGARQATLRLNVPSTGGDDPAGRVQFTYGTGYTVAGSIEMSHTTNNMKFLTGTTERMRIDSAGRVGIGVTNPSSTLDISAPANVAPLEINAATDSYNYTTIRNAAGGDVAYIGLGPALISGAASTDFALRAQAGNMIFASGGATERMRIDSSGNVGIGGNGTGNGLGVYLSKGTGANFFEASDGTKTMITGSDSTQDFVKIGSLSAHPVGFVVGNGEKMRIDSSGNVGIGTSSPTANLHVRATTDGTEANAHFKIEGAVSTYAAHHWLDTNAYYIGQNSTLRAVRIYSSAESSGVNLAAGGTSWGTFSDERLKYDVEPVENAVESLSNLRTVKYRLKDVDSAEDKKKIGLMAQDLVGVLDEAIDPVKKTGDDTEYMSIKYTELVPVLVKAIQEQQETITALTARIEQLEN